MAKKSPKKKGGSKKDSPKKGKLPKQKVYDDSWRKELIESTINDLQGENIKENWSMIVAMINPAYNDSEVEYLKHFEKQALDGDRSVIKYVSFDETMFMINQIGSETYTGDSDIICYPEAFKEANKLLDSENHKISSEVMGMLIKTQLLTMKQTDLKIRRQKEEVINGLKKESDAYYLCENSSKKSKGEKGGKKEKKSPKKGEKSAKKKKKGAKKDAKAKKGNKKKENAIKKFDTTLRTRGEEWRDKVYIDDHPLHGPNLYVALTNFLDPDLPKILLELQVPLVGVVRLKIYSSIESSYSISSPRVISSQQLYKEYWSIIEKYRFNIHTADFYKSLSFFSFFPPYKPIDVEMETFNNLKNIYHDISYLLYDLNDLQRQHSNYLSNMEVLTVASPSDETIQYEKYFAQLPPNECFNELFVLNCLIDTIAHDYESQIHLRKSLSDKLSRIEIEDNVDIPKLFLKTEVNESIDKYEILLSSNEKCPSVQISKESGMRITNLNEEYKYMKDLIIINNGDFCKQQAFHLDYIYSDDMQNITLNILQNMPFTKFSSSQQTNNEISGKSDYYCYLTFMEKYLNNNNANATEIRQFITLLICQKLHDNYPFMNLVPPTLMEEYKIRYLKRTVSTKLLKNRLISKTSFHYCQCNPEIDQFDETLCPDICEIMVKQFCSIMKHYNMMESMDNSSLLQKLYSAFNNFNSMKYKYNKLIDGICIMFSNRYDFDRIFTKEWQNHIPTPVCLQDFFDYVIDENYDWMKLQEEIYDEKMALEYEKRRKKIDSDVSIVPPRFCLDAEYLDTDLFIEGSLKFDLWVKSMHKDDANKKKKEKSPKGKEGKGKGSAKKGSSKKKSPKEKSPKKAPTKKGSTEKKSAEKGSAKKSKNKKHAVEEIQPPEFDETKTEAEKTENSSRTEIEPKHFVGYNLGDRRIQNLGKDMTYFCKDGCRVSSSYTMHTYPAYVEEYGLKICFHKHFITMHRIQSPYPLKNDKCFVMTTENDVIMSFKEYTVVDVNAGKSLNLMPEKLSEIQADVLQSTQPADYAKLSSHQQDTGEKSRGSTTSNTFKSTEKSKSALGLVSNYFCLTISWPSSLTIQTVHDNTTGSFPLYIKQQYLSKGPECCSITDEMFRCMTLNGEVLILELDGQMKILRPNNLYIKYVDYQSFKEEDNVIIDDILSTTSYNTNITDQPDAIEKKLSQNQESGEAIIDEKVFNEEIGEDYGENEVKQLTSQEIYMKKLLSESDRYYQYGEMYTRTPDEINSLLNKDGILTVSFPDGTQITSYYIVEDLEIYPEWTSAELYIYFHNDCSEMIAESRNSIEKSSGTLNENAEKNDESYVLISMVYTMEHPNYSTITSDRSNNTISMKMPDDCKIVINSDGSYSVELDEISNVLLNNDRLNVSYEACHCGPYHTKIDVNLNCLVNTNEVENTEWANIVDSCGKKVSVNVEGFIQVESSVEELIEQFTKGNAEVRSNESPNIGAGDSARANENEVEKPNDSLLNPEPIINLFSMVEDIDNIHKSNEFTELNKSNRSIESIIYSNGRHEDCICSAPKLHEDRRFFILQRNNTGQELVHDDFVEKYIKDCNTLPFGYLYENTCPCEEQTEKTTKVTFEPVTKNQSQKWKMKKMYPSKPSTFADSLSGDDIMHRMMTTKQLPKVFTMRSLEPILAKDIAVDLEEMKASLLSFHDVMTTQAEVSQCHSCQCLLEQDTLIENRRKHIIKRAIDELTSELERLRTDPGKIKCVPFCGENNNDEDHSEKCMQCENTPPSEVNTEVEEEELTCSQCVSKSSSALVSILPEKKGLEISEECKMDVVLSDENVSELCDCEQKEDECFCDVELLCNECEYK